MAVGILLAIKIPVKSLRSGILSYISFKKFSDSSELYTVVFELPIVPELQDKSVLLFSSLLDDGNMENMRQK